MSLLGNGVLTQCLDVDLEYERPKQDFHEFRPIHSDPVSSWGDGNFCLLGKSVGAMLARPVDEKSMFLGLYFYFFYLIAFPISGYEYVMYVAPLYQLFLIPAQCHPIQPRLQATGIENTTEQVPTAAAAGDIPQ